MTASRGGVLERRPARATVDASRRGGGTMSLDLILVIGAVAVGLAYFVVRSNRKQRQLSEQARRVGN